MTVDENKLLGGAVNALMSIGDELGSYEALARGPQTPAELARGTKTNAYGRQLTW
jgi:hypothetical protein